MRSLGDSISLTSDRLCTSGTEDADTNVPVAMAHTLAARIPDSHLTLFHEEGHLVVPKHWDEILAALLNAA